MTGFMKKMSSVLKSDSGAVAVEYGLMVGLVSVAIIASVTGLGTQLKTMFTTISTDISTAANAK